MNIKYLFKTVLLFTLCFLLVACGTKAKTVMKAEEEPEIQEEILDLDTLLQDASKVDLSIIETIYTVQDEEDKVLYPDLLQVIIQNNTDKDIKDAIVAFVAWDANNLPVKLKGSIDFGDGSYVKEVYYRDINLIGGATYGENSGFEMDESIEVSKFKAIVIHYEDINGETWDNPYYENFKAQYVGKKYIE